MLQKGYENPKQMLYKRQINAFKNMSINDLISVFFWEKPNHLKTEQTKNSA